MQDVTDTKLISIIECTVAECGCPPLSLFTILSTSDARKVVAIREPEEGEVYFLGDHSYSNYQEALTKVGAILDKIDMAALMIEFKKGHNISYPAFNAGYESDDNAINPYQVGSDNFFEWESGFDNRRR